MQSELGSDHLAQRRVTFFVLVIVCIVPLAGCAPSANDVDATRFNINRQFLADGALDSSIIPLNIGEYGVQPTSGWVPPLQGSRQYIGLYITPNGRKRIVLTAILTSQKLPLNTILTYGSDHCGESTGSATLFPSALVSYGYAGCKGTFQFNWINGNWVLNAASYSGVTANDLLAFVNLYPY